MRRVLFGALVILGALSAQPTCNKCSATYIAASEMEAYEQRAIANHIIDQQVRAVDIGKVSEVYHIIDGSATLVTGSDIVGAKTRPADNEAVRLLNGPGNNAENIRDGVTYHLKPGDVIVIPAGVGHWYKDR